MPFGWGKFQLWPPLSVSEESQTDVDLFIGESEDAHKQVYGDGGYENQAKFSHELIAGGAAFEGMKLFEDRQRKEG